MIKNSSVGPYIIRYQCGESCDVGMSGTFMSQVNKEMVDIAVLYG